MIHWMRWDARLTPLALAERRRQQRLPIPLHQDKVVGPDGPQYKLGAHEIARRMELAGMSPGQRARAEKVYTEPFFLTSRPSDPSAACLKFDVSGSKADVYVVSLVRSPPVGRDEGAFTCTCMDARLGCRRLGCVCKHVCFVVLRVLRRPDFFGVGSLAGVAEIFARFESLATEDTLRPLPRPHDPSAPSGSGSGGNAAFETVARPPDPGDDCPVCYDTLAPFTGKKLLGCPECGRGIHEACARRWLAVAACKTCVYCRSPVWRAFKL